MVASSSLLLILASAASASHVAHFTARCARTATQTTLHLQHDSDSKPPRAPKHASRLTLRSRRLLFGGLNSGVGGGASYNMWAPTMPPALMGQRGTSCFCMIIDTKIMPVESVQSPRPPPPPYNPF